MPTKRLAIPHSQLTPTAFWMQTAANGSRITAVCIQNAERGGKRQVVWGC